MRRSLLVGSDPEVIVRYRELFLAERVQWGVELADDAESAAAVFEDHDVDVLLVDLEQSAENRLAILDLARRAAPSTARVALLGEVDPQFEIQTGSLAHRVLARACPPIEFHDALLQALRYQELLTDHRIRGLVTGLTGLPPQPRVFAELTSMLADPKANIVDLAGVVETDIAIAAKVLKLANSSFYGLGRRLGNLRQAVAYLGVRALRLFVLTAEVEEMMVGLVPIEGFDAEAIFRHGEATGIMARSLMSGPDTPDAFAAGLLQDVGQLVLATVAPEVLAESVARAREDSVALHRAEAATYGFSHAEVGAYLLALWGLPASVVEAVAHHHDAPMLGHRRIELADAVYLARAHLQEAAELGVDPLDGIPVCQSGWLERINAGPAFSPL